MNAISPIQNTMPEIPAPKAFRISPAKNKHPLPMKNSLTGILRKSESFR